VRNPTADYTQMMAPEEGFTLEGLRRIRGDDLGAMAYPDPPTPVGPTDSDRIEAIVKHVSAYYDIPVTAFLSPSKDLGKRRRAATADYAYRAVEGVTWPVVGNVMNLRDASTAASHVRRTHPAVIAEIEQIASSHE